MNPELAQEVVVQDPIIKDLAKIVVRHQVGRLVVEEPHRLPAYTVEMDILENLKRIFHFAKRLARTIGKS